jgi:hypothetical protein
VQRLGRKQRLKRNSRATAVDADKNVYIHQSTEQEHQQEDQEQQCMHEDDPGNEPSLQPVQQESPPPSSAHVQQLPSAFLQPPVAYSLGLTRLAVTAAAAANGCEKYFDDVELQQLRVQFQAEQEALFTRLEQQFRAHKEETQHECQLQMAAVFGQAQPATPPPMQQLPAEVHVASSGLRLAVPALQERLEWDLPEQCAQLNQIKCSMLEALKQHNIELKRKIADMEAQLQAEEPAEQQADGFSAGNLQSEQQPPAGVAAATYAADTAMACEPPAGSCLIGATVDITQTYGSAVPTDVHVRLGHPCGSGAVSAVHFGNLALSRHGAEMVLGPVAVKTF